LLNYDWLKIIISIIAGIVVWSLLFTTTSTRLTTGESFQVVLYDDVADNTGGQTFLSKVKKEGYLSYDVLESSVNRIQGAGNYSAAYMLSVRMSTHEGDVIIADATPGEPKEEGKDPEPSKMQTIVDNGAYLITVDNYLAAAEKYLSDNGFIKDGEIDEKKAESYFLDVRVPSARNYRRTYTTEEKKKQGVKDEIARIKKIKESLDSVKSAIEKAKAADKDFLWYGERPVYENGEKIGTEKVAFGFDLAKLSDNGNISDLWVKTSTGSADGLVLGVFNFGSYQYDMQFESLSFIDYLIRTYSSYAG